MKDKVRCIVKRVGEEPTVSILVNTLEAFQAAVNGYIEPIHLPNGELILVNEEGLINGDCHFNCYLRTSNNNPYPLFGNVLFVGEDGEGFDDCKMTVEEVKEWLE